MKKKLPEKTGVRRRRVPPVIKAGDTAECVDCPRIAVLDAEARCPECREAARARR